MPSSHENTHNILTSDHPTSVANVATIRIGSLLHNLGVFRRATPGIEIMAVIKADAYGHGSLPVAQALTGAGVTYLAVASVAEAISLREGGIHERILVFGAPRRATAFAYAEFDLEATITSLESIEVLREVRASVHLNLDTGMGRLGLQSEELAEAVRRIERSKHLRLCGMSTHFATASRPDSEFADRQWTDFKKALATFGTLPAEIHAASSSAVFTIPASVHPDIVSVVRTGVGLYGLLDLPEGLLSTPLRPVMTFTSEIAHVKMVPPGTPISYKGTWRSTLTTRIATVAAGYADGVARHLSNCGIVYIAGRRYPIVGTVCMDSFMVDLGMSPDSKENIRSDDPEAIRPGETVTIFGEGGPSAVELAALAGTIPYEIVCGISSRVPRRYLA